MGRKCRQKIVGWRYSGGIAEADMEIVRLDAQAIGQRRLDAAADRVARLGRIDLAGLFGKDIGIAIRERSIRVGARHREAAGSV